MSPTRSSTSNTITERRGSSSSGSATTAGRRGSVVSHESGGVLEESAESTISLDSEACSNLTSTQFLRGTAPEPNQDRLLVKMHDIERREDEVEHVLSQNNDLMRTMVKKIRHSKQKKQEIIDSNIELKQQVAALTEELREKKSDIQALSNDKNNRATILKIDQAAAAVKDLRDQLYEKDRLITCLKSKVEQELKSMSSEADMLRLQLQDRENIIIESEKRCKTLTHTLDENQNLIENAKEEILKHKKVAEEYKNQLAVTTCQEAINRRVLEQNLSELSSMSPSYQRRIAVLSALITSTEGHDARTLDSRSLYSDTRSNSSIAPMGTSYGATLAASHGDQTAPPTPSYVDYNEYRHY